MFRMLQSHLIKIHSKLRIPGNASSSHLIYDHSFESFRLCVLIRSKTWINMRVSIHASSSDERLKSIWEFLMMHSQQIWTSKDSDVSVDASSSNERQKSICMFRWCVLIRLKTRINVGVSNDASSRDWKLKRIWSFMMISAHLIDNLKSTLSVSVETSEDVYRSRKYSRYRERTEKIVFKFRPKICTALEHIHGTDK